jgi:beta-phosphoglucomutase-like phosphatase (HAD superfamily)
MLLAACAATGVKPSDAVMIDDTPVGTLAADAAGMRAIGFSAASDAAKLLATGHPVAHTMTQVQKLLGL